MKLSKLNINLLISWIISGLVVAFYGIFIVGEGIFGSTPIWTIKDPIEAIMMAQMLLAVTSLIFGWFKPIWGGLCAILLMTAFMFVGNINPLEIKSIPLLLIPFAGFVQLVVGLKLDNVDVSLMFYRLLFGSETTMSNKSDYKRDVFLLFYRVLTLFVVLLGLLAVIVQILNVSLKPDVRVAFIIILMFCTISSLCLGLSKPFWGGLFAIIFALILIFIKYINPFQMLNPFNSFNLKNQLANHSIIYFIFLLIAIMQIIIGFELKWKKRSKSNNT